KSPRVLISATLLYQDLRGFTRSLSLPVPISRSQVHLTSAAVNGLPSCHLTPWRSGKVSSVPSSLHDQLVARSGTTVSRLDFATCWSYMTRLLKTPIIGCNAARVDSSRIDMLAGLSKCDSLRTPPGFCASAPLPKSTEAISPPAVTHARRSRIIYVYLSADGGFRCEAGQEIRDWLDRHGASLYVAEGCD